VVNATSSPATALNPEQRCAAEHPLADGPLLVIAGAGSGKTLTLASRLAWLVRQGADPNRVLLMTFSRRAAAEMARRAGRLLHEALRLPQHTAPPVLPWCGTFHSVAARLLREAAPSVGLGSGFTVLDRADAEDLMSITRQQLGFAQTSQRFPMAATCVAIHSRSVNTRQPLQAVLHSQWPWCETVAADLERLFTAFSQAKQQQQSLDFDDLLLSWWHLMHHPGTAAPIAARFDHVLVDEVQDINRLQADILHALKPTGLGLTAVGDDAQSIYAFRGAEVQHILGFAARFEPPAKVLALEQNYRSSPEILAAANAVIALAKAGFPKRLWSDRPAGCTPQLNTVADDATQATAVVDTVLAQRETGLALKRQAVLFRTSSHSATLELELVRRNVPFVKYGGLKFMEAAHVKDVLAVLRWADNPAAQLAALRTARLVPGMGPASVRRLLQHNGPLHSFEPPRAAREPWHALVALMAHLRSAHAGWPDDLARVKAWYQPHLQRLFDDARVRDADLDQLLHLAAGHGSRARFVTELTLDPPNASSDEAGPPLRDEDYLVLSTIHSAKGQEWSAVHVLNVVDGCMPADMATGRAEDIEEERRLLYVAMTRARDSLHLWVPQRFYVTQQRALGGQHLYALRSRFIPPDLLMHFDVQAQTRTLHAADTTPGAATATAGDPVPPHAAHAPAYSAPVFDLRAALRQGVPGPSPAKPR
jgi:DNA helicase II / ATP-dependent DNA helicase PcrA